MLILIIFNWSENIFIIIPQTNKYSVGHRGCLFRFVYCDR